MYIYVYQCIYIYVCINGVCVGVCACAFVCVCMCTHGMCVTAIKEKEVLNLRERKQGRCVEGVGERNRKGGNTFIIL